MDLTAANKARLADNRPFQVALSSQFIARLQHFLVDETETDTGGGLLYKSTIEYKKISSKYMTVYERNGIPGDQISKQVVNRLEDGLYVSDGLISGDITSSDVDKLQPAIDAHIKFFSDVNTDDGTTEYVSP